MNALNKQQVVNVLNRILKHELAGVVRYTPATWTMMLLGFGLVGSTVRRRSTRRVAALA
jgi:bacterioferritin (cytochrome b1)